MSILPVVPYDGPGYRSSMDLLNRIGSHRTLEGSLFLLLSWQPAQNIGHRPQPLILSRIENEQVVLAAADYASKCARERAEAESRELAEVLSALLGPRYGGSDFLCVLRQLPAPVPFRGLGEYLMRSLSADPNHARNLLKGLSFRP
jgi:hypothetical protein